MIWVLGNDFTKEQYLRQPEQEDWISVQFLWFLEESRKSY